MDWVGIWNTDEGTQGWRFSPGGVATLDADGCRAAYDDLSPDRIVVAGAQAAPADLLPAPVCPGTLGSGPGGIALPALTQQTPLHRVDGHRLTAIGFLALNDGWDGVICLPGPVTHWIEVSAGEAVFIQSALTLRLAAVLGAADATPDQDAVAQAISRPERMAGALRGAELSRQPEVALGWLIGAELASAKPLWLGRQVAVLGQGGADAAYRFALQAQGLPVTVGGAERMALKGMQVLGDRLGLSARG